MFNENRIMRIYSLVTNFLEEYRENIEACNGRRDYFALVVSILMFAKLTEIHFKENYDNKHSIEYANETFSSLNDMADEMVVNFLKEHANKTMN